MSSENKDAADDRPVEPYDEAQRDDEEVVWPEDERRRKRLRYARRTGYLLLGAAVAAIVIVYLRTPIPSAQSAARAEGSVFYYADGKTSFAKQGPNRVLVPLDRVPKHVRSAVIAAENRTFYSDPGVSVTGTTRAVFATLFGRELQGGSTVTQQMVRNYYGGIGQERTVVRKLKEIMVALKVGRERDKDWILEQYLNTIYFGRDAYGIQAAAQAYYNTDVERLTPAQAAYLAAAIQQPSYFADPSADRRAAAERRWRYVVDGMVRIGAVKAADAAGMRFPAPERQKRTDVLKGQVGYMRDLAMDELESRGYSEDEINRGGLRIVTTFDKARMDAAKKAVTSNLPEHLSSKVLTGLVSVDPRSGAVTAFYAGRDYLKPPYINAAWSSAPQAGSGFKPYVLATALDEGESLSTTVDGSSPITLGDTTIRNSEGHSYGTVSLVTATRLSINTAYVDLGMRTGLDRVTSMAEKLGIPKEQLTANHANTGAAFSLGIVSVSPVQQAGAYATFAAGGVHHKPHVIKSITRPGGRPVNVVEKGKRAFGGRVAGDATYAMTKVVEAGTGTAARLSDRPAAGKTGTTDEGRAIWFNGFIPQLATSVAMFRTDNRPMKIPGYSVYGGELPARIWHAYMKDVTRGMAVEKFGSRSSSDDSSIGDSREDLALPNADEPGATAEPQDHAAPVPEGGPTQRPSDAPTGPTPAPDPQPTPTITTSAPTTKPPRPRVTTTRHF
jgi:membrane peptidoglycan carboxypeptidase